MLRVQLKVLAAVHEGNTGEENNGYVVIREISTYELALGGGALSRNGVGTK
jgi:hypothetical protein